jgi:hypothetical protein
MSTTTESIQQRLHNAHEHLRHDATSDAPEVVRAHNRQVELAAERQANAKAAATDEDQYRNK